MYECLTRGDDTDRHPTFGDNFWSEFFLLRPKISVLEAEIGKVSGINFSQQGKKQSYHSYSAIHPACRKMLKIRILGIPPAGGPLM